MCQLYCFLFFLLLLLKMTLLLMINGNHLVEDNQFYLHSKDARMELIELDSSFAICILFKVFEFEIPGTFSLFSVLFLSFISSIYKIQWFTESELKWHAFTTFSFSFLSRYVCHSISYPSNSFFSKTFVLNSEKKFFSFI